MRFECDATHSTASVACHTRKPPSDEFRLFCDELELKSDELESKNDEFGYQAPNQRMLAPR